MGGGPALLNLRYFFFGVLLILKFVLGSLLLWVREAAKKVYFLNDRAIRALPPPQPPWPLPLELKGPPNFFLFFLVSKHLDTDFEKNVLPPNCWTNRPYFNKPVKRQRISWQTTKFNMFTWILIFWYRPFHKTLQRSSAILSWVSGRLCNLLFVNYFFYQNNKF